jgi:hypothetical protein
MTVQTDWEVVGNIEAAGLAHSRMQLHSAAQLVAAVGKALARPEPDDSHTSLEWNSERKAFASVYVDQPPVQAWLEVLSLTLVVSGPPGEQKQQLHGYTLDETFTWLRTTLKQHGADGERLSKVGDRSQLPDGVFGPADKFDAGERAEFSEWARQYANADLLLQEVKRAKPAFSAIRVWPHHFDIASLCAWKQENNESRTIGIGLSPGDASYNEPYWYVTPSPYQDAQALAPVDGAGSWHTQGWIGAVLPTSRLVRAGGKQEEQVRKFLNSAIRICEDALHTNVA